MNDGKKAQYRKNVLSFREYSEDDDINWSSFKLGISFIF